MSEIVMSQDQYRETFPAQYREACADDPDNVRGKPFTLPAGDANHSDVITGVSSPSTSHLAPKLGPVSYTHLGSRAGPPKGSGHAADDAEGVSVLARESDLDVGEDGLAHW